MISTGNEPTYTWSEMQKQIALALKSTPPQRTWVNLTAEEIEDIRMEYHVADGVVLAGYERAIETKLKEKNT